MRAPLLLSVLAAGLLGVCGIRASATHAGTGEGTKTMPMQSDTIADAADEVAAADAGDRSARSPCSAEKLSRWLNLLPTDTVKTAIAATVGERAIRYYTQGDPVTLDFSPARLNVELGADGRIKLFRCG